MRQGRSRTQATHERTPKGPRKGPPKGPHDRPHTGMHKRPTRRHRHGGPPRPGGRLASHDDRPPRAVGRRRRRAPRLHREGLPGGEPHPAGTRLPRPVFTNSDRSPQRAAQPRDACSTTAGSPALDTSPSSRSTRASSTRPRRASRKNPAYFDPLNLLELALAGECSGRGHHARHARPGVPQVRAPDPLHRASSTTTRSCTCPTPTTRSCSAPCARPSTSARSRRRHHLLRLRRHGPRAPAGDRGLRRGARARHVHRAVVLPAQPGLQEGRRQLRDLRRPHRPGQPHGRHDRGRHHQAEAARRTTAATRRSASAAPTRSSTTSSRPTTRSTSPAGRSSTATPAASA